LTEQRCSREATPRKQSAIRQVVAHESPALDARTGARSRDLRDRRASSGGPAACQRASAAGRWTDRACSATLPVQVGSIRLPLSRAASPRCRAMPPLLTPVPTEGLPTSAVKACNDANETRIAFISGHHPRHDHQGRRGRVARPPTRTSAATISSRVHCGYAATTEVDGNGGGCSSARVATSMCSHEISESAQRSSAAVITSRSWVTFCGQAKVLNLSSKSRERCRRRSGASSAKKSNARGSMSSCRSRSGGTTRVTELRRNIRSWRRSLRLVRSSMSAEVVEIRRTSTGQGRSSPMRRITRSSTRRRRIACWARGIHATSSKTTVPWLAVSKTPAHGLRSSRVMPHMSFSRVSSDSLQSSATIGRCARGDWLWIQRASVVFPTPGSPTISTLIDPTATRRARVWTSAMAGNSSNLIQLEGSAVACESQELRCVRRSGRRKLDPRWAQL
jgi:hypothetical protein